MGKHSFKTPATDSKIAQLVGTLKTVPHKCFDGEALQLNVYGKNGRNFYGNASISGIKKRIPLGKWKNLKTGIGEWKVEDVRKFWNDIKPKLEAEGETDSKKINKRVQQLKGLTSAPDEPAITLRWLVDQWMDRRYKHRVKVRTFDDRKGWLDQVISFFGEEFLLDDLFDGNNGRKKIREMMGANWGIENKSETIRKVRGLLLNAFTWGAIEQYVDLSDVLSLHLKEKFEWEDSYQPKKFANGATGNPSLAVEVKEGQWGRVPEFIQTVSTSTNRDTGEKLATELVTKLATITYLLAPIRVAVIAQMRWDWFVEEEDYWEVPAGTFGLKDSAERLSRGECKPFHIPSTPQLKKVVDIAREINGRQEYVFYSKNRKEKYVEESSINNHLKDLGWANIQNAHGWRDVPLTASQEHWIPKKLKRGIPIHEIVQRQLGHNKEKQGVRGHYDESTILEPRREFMNWWNQTLEEFGLLDHLKEQKISA